MPSIPREVQVRKLLAVTAVSSAVALVGSTGALAANPPGTGQPNQTCQLISPTNAFAPGNSSSSPGSVFNEPQINSTDGGKGGQQYNLVGAPSQYDVACFQMSQK
jgi:hypothetical protein